MSYLRQSRACWKDFITGGADRVGALDQSVTQPMAADRDKPGAGGVSLIAVAPASRVGVWAPGGSGGGVTGVSLRSTPPLGPMPVSPSTHPLPAGAAAEAPTGTSGVMRVSVLNLASSGSDSGSGGSPTSPTVGNTSNPSTTSAAIRNPARTSGAIRSSPYRFATTATAPAPLPRPNSPPRRAFYP